MDIQGDFVPNIDPKKKPQRPEPNFPDYEDDLEEDCPVCNNRLDEHSTKQIVEFALREVRGVIRT